MKIRSWGLAIRLLAVVAAIYAFFSFRSELERHQQPRGAIPVQVVSSKVCGSVHVEKASAAPAVDFDITPELTKAILAPGTAVDLRDSAQCERLQELHGSVFVHNEQHFRVVFKPATSNR